MPARHRHEVYLLVLTMAFARMAWASDSAERTIVATYPAWSQAIWYGLIRGALLALVGIAWRSLNGLLLEGAALALAGLCGSYGFAFLIHAGRADLSHVVFVVAFVAVFAAVNLARARQIGTEITARRTARLAALGALQPRRPPREHAHWGKIVRWLIAATGGLAGVASFWRGRSKARKFDAQMHEQNVPSELGRGDYDPRSTAARFATRSTASTWRCSGDCRHSVRHHESGLRSCRTLVAFSQAPVATTTAQRVARHRRFEPPQPTGPETPAGPGRSADRSTRRSAAGQPSVPGSGGEWAGTWSVAP